jgi:tetratricopeptide (TPR) repeat protein
MDFRTSTYFNYYKIDKSSYHEKVRFYEKHKKELGLLPFNEKIELDIDYSFALFEIGKYRKYLERADRLIEVVIMENIYTINGRNAYEDLLFNKAACYYNLELYDKCIYICRELIKINPKHVLSQKLYMKSLKKKGMNWYELNKAIAVVFLLSGISIILVELLVVDPFYEMYSHHVKIFRKTLFASSIGLLLFNELWIRYQCMAHVKRHSRIQK